MNIISAQWGGAAKDAVIAITDTAGAVIVPVSGRDFSGGYQAILTEWLKTNTPTNELIAASDSTAQAIQTINANTTAVSSEADAAMDNLRNYIAASSPTTAQTVGVVKILCRVAIILYRLNFHKLDATT